MSKQISKKSSKTTYKGSELVRSAAGVQKDVFSVVLNADKQYTTEQADELANKFLAKGVK